MTYIGRKFGYLEPLRDPTDNDMKLYGQKFENAYGKLTCQCDCGKLCIRTKQSLKKNDKEGKISSCGCHKSKNSDWDKLCVYVEKNVMDYDDTKHLDKNMSLRLMGLRDGKYIANNNIKDTSEYSYKVILNTFKSCYMQIQNAKRISFNDDKHKFNYMLKIVEPELSNIYERMKNSEKADESIQNMDFSHLNAPVVKPKPTEKKRENENLKNYW